MNVYKTVGCLFGCLVDLILLAAIFLWLVPLYIRWAGQ